MKTSYLWLTVIAYMTFIHLVTAQEQWIFKSPYLSKPDTVLVFKPASYQATNKYPLTYLLHGYSANYKQWSLTTDCQQLANQYQMIIVCPDGFVSWYVNSPFDKGSRMEDFFFNELVPYVHQHLQIDSNNVFISGLSMGGYGALRYFLLHPDYFNTAGSTSGGLEVDYPLLKSASILFFKNPRVTDDLTKLLGKPGNTWHIYNIVSLLKEAKTKPKSFLVDCGTEDILFPVHQRLKTTCDQLNIPVTYISQPGNHNTEYWHNAIQHHFIYFSQHIR
ncbi:alpha/beta hydrolase-fold protein [Cytophagaceae bacterium YF14B1]|uniref:Alpha/beta hydrolase-fold protein n=1 Tax=Xanthocytophaga flava TaxID=3048013 RepID=A0AAE3QPC1_9BACT|nr:alpha/beta hydrolase-fold protein [Xanthocytophaga flavus]MDJ1483007.1 alpha/beta hydrolase-fold protein [Xanthocytophaga flavus]